MLGKWLKMALNFGKNMLFGNNGLFGDRSGEHTQVIMFCQFLGDNIRTFDGYCVFDSGHNSLSAYAPIIVPDKSTLLEVTAYCAELDPTNTITYSLVRYRVNALGATTISTVVGNGVLSKVTQDYAVVDNENYQYALRIIGLDNSSGTSDRIYGAKLKFVSKEN